MQIYADALTIEQKRLVEVIESGFSKFTGKDVNYHDNYSSDRFLVRNQFVEHMSKYRSRALWATKEEGAKSVTVSIKRKLHEVSQHDMKQAREVQDISNREPEGRMYGLKIKVTDLRSKLPIIKTEFDFDHDKASQQYFVESWSTTMLTMSAIENLFEQAPYGSNGTDMISGLLDKDDPLDTMRKRGEIVTYTSKSSEHSKFQLTIPSGHVSPPIRGRIRQEMDTFRKTLTLF